MRKSFPFYYEIAVWIIYAGIYKYAYYLESESEWLHQVGLPSIPKGYFPSADLVVFAVAMTLYVIPFYRWISPWLLTKRRYGWFLVSIPVYFAAMTRISDWAVSGFFARTAGGSGQGPFYAYLYHLSSARLSRGGWDLALFFTDLLAFLSVVFVRYAFDTEAKKHQLERDNLALQLDALKAQLHPHFLFNTLNSLYGMSLTASPETPVFILRLADMMRYILYDCGHNHVPLQKDLAFVGNYLEMEKKRYPGATIRLDIREDGKERTIAPLLLIPFLENSFKHGAHRMHDRGYIDGEVWLEDGLLRFRLKNDLFVAPAGVVFPQQHPTLVAGGIGIANVRRRLMLYYPGRHELTMTQTQLEYQVDLTIQL